MIWARTARLVLREWEDRDLDPYAAMVADPEMMRHFPAPLSRAEAAERINQMRSAWTKNGFSFAAVERIADGAFIGMAGLHRPGFDLPHGSVVEVGWSIARPYWRHGYAKEAARAALAMGFGAMNLAEIVAFTIPANAASQALMQSLGMRRDPARDFDHPNLPAESPLSRHVLYALKSQEFAP